MKTKIQKWGNSLAVRIPKSVADEMGWRRDASVQMMVKEGALMIVTEPEAEWGLDELLDGVTDDNIHHEWESAPQGNEIW